MDWLQYPAMVLGILGAYLIAQKNRLGFMSWIIGNSLWVIFGFLTQQIGILIQFVVFLGIAIYGWINWGGKNEKTELG